MLLTGVSSYWRQNRFVVGLITLPALAVAAAVLVTSHSLRPGFLFFESALDCCFWCGAPWSREARRLGFCSVTSRLGQTWARPSSCQ